MTYRDLLFDIDDTLLDFRAAEESSLQGLFSQLQIDLTPVIRERYAAINRQLWEQFERQEITREMIFERRFPQLFEEFQLAGPQDGLTAEQRYREGLNQGHVQIQHAQELLTRLQASHQFNLYIVSNGVAKTQRLRLEASGLAPFFTKVFVSEAVGHQKPAIEFFDAVQKGIDHFLPEQALIIGDSLTSDIQGGLNAGIPTVWFNPQHQDANLIQPTYEIDNLLQLLPIVMA